MIIRKADQLKYPKFSHYVKTQMPKVIAKRVIVASMSKFGALPFKEFKDALTWGRGPIIEILDLHDGSCFVDKADGCFHLTAPKMIEIHVRCVEDYEYTRPLRFINTQYGRRVYYVGTILLHELCHWGNYNNVPKIRESDGDMGTKFAERVYGDIFY